ncbi:MULTISPECIES: dTDP-4-dehydrorhamnose 3,5-epimerase [unclassified Polynucleobacter]|uniref:dTDP-4-dehydrorhamnose 3,5-epimerase n=1 Tax=unclassified Polynucleobacter TaxID=2640945 RepID=UPI000BCB61DD|nr:MULTISPECIES: dTDP-4-dehydrorhamnose 3,5-epimerase [unclassified Polynucleobacter]OYY13153.1 MAG: dTDP-4-dehydrorhamnose 3,5-epimerase [Polynucleobacter sp. 35-46-11]OZA76464.1 MAG: dTDP-4-dehydrorhamnose 3,5-epimerase [Polynucleobacter sp. 39-46-10]
MNITQTAIPGVLLLEPEVFVDQRGLFYESFSSRRFKELTGVTAEFVQDNVSLSAQNVLRGLHYQIHQPQGKLVQVIAGEVFDVAVDLRRSSPTFGCWTGAILSAENRLQQWIPPGFAHGFVVTGANAEVHYKTTDYYAPAYERCIIWTDPVIGIRWPELPVILSDKDIAGLPLKISDLFE